MANSSDELIRGSGYARAGFPGRYDEHRPAPPVALLDVLCRYARTERPALVVDLGSGTGLSTRVWTGRAVRVVGVEPNAAMRALAESAGGAEYLDAYGDATGLADGVADVVTCSQSFHWMEPEPTLAEAARILRGGGVFATYDYDLPPAVDPEVDAAFARYLRDRRQARERLGLAMGADRRPKEQHLARIEESGRFGYVREILLHSQDVGGVDRVVGLARSIGPELETVEESIEELRAVAERVLGEQRVPWLVSYRVRFGIRRARR